MASLENVQKRLASHVETIQSTEFLEQSLKLLRQLPFKNIRCIALGSPTQEFQALYQLALLKLLAKEFDIPPANISLYDPIFTDDDVHLLTTFEKYVVDENEQTSPHYTSETLYYMPHAPRSVTDRFLANVKPKWILGNDVRVTAGSLSQAKFLEEYPRLAKLVHIAEVRNTDAKEASNNVSTDSMASPRTPGLQQSEFKVVTRRKRNRPKKHVYVEPKLDYDLVDVYFDTITVTRIDSPDSAPWNDSFSDLALNVINPIEPNRNE